MTQLTNEDLELLRDTANRFFSEKLPTNSLRQLRDDRDKIGFDRSLWQEMAEMGWTGILLDEPQGGLDFGYEALGMILEQSGKTLAASPLVSTVLLGAQLVAKAGNSTQREQILAGVIKGELILALAHEESARHDPSSINTRAVKDGDNYILNGRKIFVLDGHIADRLVVVARTHGDRQDRNGVSLFIVDANSTGINRTRTIMVDGRNTANIELVDVKAASLGAVGSAFGILETVLDGACAAIAAEMLGTGEEAFDRTIEYLKVREQFGAKLATFQALKHRAAEMYCEIELTRSAVYGALVALDGQDPESPQLCSIAKAKACEMLELVSNEALQMHGGIGMTDASDIGLFLKRARVAQQILGDMLYHRERFANLVGL
jgi:alkylation response protein AidB-like acyl-CoA dehydrogenase